MYERYRKAGFSTDLADEAPPKPYDADADAAAQPKGDVDVIEF